MNAVLQQGLFLILGVFQRIMMLIVTAVTVFSRAMKEVGLRYRSKTRIVLLG
jgi:hypothetical protein